MRTEIKSDRLPTAMSMRLLGVMLLALCLPVSALAHIINRVDVQRAGDEAEIVIQFDTTVQYQRHSPLNEGSRLNIYFVVTGIDPDATSSLEEPMLPKDEVFAGATFRYPEPDSSMLVTFPESTKFRVRQGGDARSLSIFIPITAAASAMLTPSPAETESMARSYLEKAKSALSSKEPAVAIEALNSLLNLPANASSQEAQEMIGMAYEQNGENAKARTEYEFYVKTYPKGEGVERVNERLAKLAAIPAAEPTVRIERRKEDTGWQVTGGFGQTRYYGNSSTILEPLRVIICSQDQLDNPALVPANEQCSQTANANAVNPQSTARTDQSALVSSLDLMARSRSGSSDTRFVVRDVDTRYFLHGDSYRPDKNRLNAAYYENSDRELGYMMRLGRQTASGGGVLGRFDGAFAGYKFSQDWRLNGVAGNVVEFGSPHNKTFYGAGIDLLSLPANWSGNAFVIQQDVGSMTDRQAVGFEARYFDPKQNYFAMVDYDTSFAALNIAMFQANWNADAGTTYYLTLDYRRSPVLMLTSVSDVTGMDIGTLVNTIGDRAAREDIKRITPMMTMLSAGLMHPYSEQWQLGGDIQVSNMGATDASQNLPLTAQMPTQYAAQKSTGNTYVYSARAIGSGLFFSNDMTVFSGSYIDAKSTTGPTTYSAQSYAVTHVARPFEGWQFDTSLRLYYQDKSDGEKLERINPSFRALYRLGNNLSFEAEINQEDETIKDGISPGNSNRRYYYAGYRWDL